MESSGSALPLHRKIYLPPVHLKPRCKEELCPQPANVKRRPQNSVRRKLPSAIAHFYPFLNPQGMGEVHPSWYRTFLPQDEVWKEIKRQRERNLRVLSDIKQLQKEIHHLEIQLRMKEYVEQSVKGGETEAESLIMFPDKSLSLNEPETATTNPSTTPAKEKETSLASFLDFTDLFIQ